MPNFNEVISKDKNYNYDMRLLKEKLMESHSNFTEKDFENLLEKAKAAITYGILSARD